MMDAEAEMQHSPLKVMTLLQLSSACIAGKIMLHSASLANHYYGPH